MRLISNCELAKHNQHELSALFAEVAKKLVRSPKGSAARRNALATLENINRAQCARHIQQKACP